MLAGRDLPVLDVCIDNPALLPAVSPPPWHRARCARCARVESRCGSPARRCSGARPPRIGQSCPPARARPRGAYSRRPGRCTPSWRWG
jgi:hypothetical protein